MARSRGAGGDKAKALDKGLKAMFRTLEQRPAPRTLEETVEQLEAGRKPKKPD